jgi:hypothetical protein
MEEAEVAVVSFVKEGGELQRKEGKYVRKVEKRKMKYVSYRL